MRYNGDMKQYGVLIVAAGILVAGFFVAGAFSNPSQNPPDGNVPAPLNIGSAGQEKAGGLILNTGGAPNGLIVQQGNVGIGTASPGRALQVGADTLSVDTSVKNISIGIAGDQGYRLYLRSGTATGGTFRITNSSNTEAIELGADATNLSYIATGGGDGLSFRPNTTASRVLFNATGGVEIGQSFTEDGMDVAAGNLVVSGSVGIGTANPSAKLGVSGSVFVGDFGATSIAGGAVSASDISWANSGKRIYTQDGLRSDGDIIVEAGRVGIGTATPGQKLSVNGIIESLTGGIKFPDGTVQTTAAGSAQKSVRVYNNVTQIALEACCSSFYKISFNSERFDAGGMHDSITNNTRLTANVAGKYYITGNIALGYSSFVNNPMIQIYLNNTTVIAQESTRGNARGVEDQMSISTLYELAAGDFVELGVNTDVGPREIPVHGNYSPEFMMVKVAD
jgi:hypothetical protein